LLGEQFVVGAEFDDASLVENGDAVGVADGGDAVRDEDGGASAHEIAQVVENFVFGVGVDAGEGVVEDKDAGAAEDGAGDGGALLLAAGEGDAALAHRGVVAVGKRLDVGGDVGGLGGSDDFFVRGIGTPKAMFSRMVSLKRKVSWGTKPMFWRRAASGNSRMGRPSMRTEPGWAS
jgi:hypothetical protein